MSQKSSFFLAVLFVANPFVILLFQNCSALPKPSASPSNEKIEQNSITETKDVVRYNFKNPL
ncbi:MAG: hypothetical protein WA160_02665 [Pseudobdellovibrio sp.]